MYVVRMYICMDVYVCMHACMYVRMNVYVCMYAHMYVYMYMQGIYKIYLMYLNRYII